MLILRLSIGFKEADETIRFCQDEKGLALHAWCLMSNHLHLIASAKNEDLSDMLKDFKKFTSK